MDDLTHNAHCTAHNAQRTESNAQNTASTRTSPYESPDTNKGSHGSVNPFEAYLYRLLLEALQ